MRAINENTRLLRPFLRGLPIIIIAMAVCIAIAKRYLKYATPMYESTSKIRLADTKDGSPSSNLFKDFDVFANANKIGAEIEVLKSQILIDKALDSLDFNISSYRIGQLRKMELYHETPIIINASVSAGLYDKPFKLDLKKNENLTLTVPSGKIYEGRLCEPIQIDKDIIIITKNEALFQAKPHIKLEDQYEFVLHSRQKLISEVLDNMDVTSIDKEIPIIRINYKSPVAKKSADFVNRLAQAYIDDYVQTKVASANIAVNFLTDQIQEAGGKLSSSESAIENYRDQNNIINIRQETETELRKLSDMKVQQTNVKMNLAAITDLYNYMNAGQKNPLDLAPNFEAYTDLLATELVKKMKILQAEKTDLLTKYTPEHEQVKAIDEKLKNVNDYLIEGINNSRKNLQVKYERLSTDIEETEEKFIGLPTREKTMGILNRRFMLNEQNYNFLNEKRTEAQISKAANISFHRIISVGEIPKSPFSPNGPLLQVLAAFLGFMGSVLLIYLVHSLKGKVNDITTIEKNSNIPVAATLPMIRGKINGPSQFKKMTIQLEIKQLIEKHKILTLSSFKTGEGKSFTTLGIARELSGKGYKVLVVDGDGELGHVSLTQGIDRVNITKLQKASNSECLDEMMNEWRNAYDMTLIKNENISDASVGLLLMKLSDANLFVMDSRGTSASMITEAELLHEEYQFPNMNFLLNKEGYNPNVVSESITIVKSAYKKLSSLRR
jgi:uncharacterized protein involved in exopolysaccharide biosynthesis